MGALKVGELYAELGLEDNLDKAMDKAEAKFKATGKGLDATAKLGLDSSELTTKLAQAESDAKDTTRTIGKQAPTLDGSKLSDGISDGLDGAEGMVSSAGGKLGGLLTAGIAGGAALGGAYVIEAFGQSLEREAGTAKLGIQLGLPPELAAAAGARSAEIYGQAFGASMSETNDAVRYVTQNIGGLGETSQEEFDAMTKGVLTLSDAFGEDLNKSTAAAGKLIKTELAKDGKEALDILARGLASPANQSEDLLDTFIEYSTVFRQLGITGPEALGMLAQGLRGGARDADTVADSLKGLVDMASAGSNDTQAAYVRLGLSYQTMAGAFAAGGPPAASALQQVTDKLAGVQDPGEKAKLAIALFGDKAVDMQGAINTIDLSKAVTEVGNVQGAMERATTATDTQSSRIEAWKRGIEGNVVGFIDQNAIPALGRLADAFHSAFGEDAGNSLRNGAKVLGEGPGGTAWAEAVMLATPAGPLMKQLGWFDDGGTIPGPVGSPQLVMAHGGETVQPTHKGASGGAPAGMTRTRRGGTTTVVKVGTAELARVQRNADRAWS